MRNNRDIAFRWSRGREDRLNGEGQTVFGLIGAQEFDQHDFPADNSARYIFFSRYPGKGDVRLSHESYAFPVERDIKGRIIESFSHYKDKKPTVVNNHLRITASDTGIPLIVYDSSDSRRSKHSIHGRALRLSNGDLYAEYHASKPIRDREEIVFFSRRGHPLKTESIEITGQEEWTFIKDELKKIFSIFGMKASDTRSRIFNNGLSDNELRDLVKEHAVVLIEGRNGYYFVYDRDARESFDFGLQKIRESHFIDNDFITIGNY